MTEQLKLLQPKVLKETGINSESSLNAKIGGKSPDFIDLPNEVIYSPDHYLSKWLEGFRNKLSHDETKHNHNNYDKLYSQIKSSEAFQEYLPIFLKRMYLRSYDELSKNRPHIDQSEIWIGENNADYGLLISPRFNKKTNSWENDKSEIRHFKPRYWSIGHILTTGLVIPDKETIHKFKDVDEYLFFFEEVIVRKTSSKYQKEIAALYVKYVKASNEPEKLGLLIPELRYNGKDKQHKYRLDFCAINAESNDKVGFEISPASTHTKISKTKKKSQKEINEEASDNFEKEMKKQKDYFRKHNIFALIYTGSELENIDSIFEDIKRYLLPETMSKKLSFDLMSNFFK